MTQSTLIPTTCDRVQPLDEAAMAAARARQDVLTKPQGSLGRLEALSVQLAGITGQSLPKVERKAVIVLAGDHGIVAEGVSIGVTLRSEYSSFLKQNGGKLPALTEVLRKKIGSL